MDATTWLRAAGRERHAAEFRRETLKDIMEREKSATLRGFVPPPIIFLSLLGIGLVLDWFYPVPVVSLPAGSRLAMGVIIVSISGVIALLSVIEFGSKRTSVTFHKPTKVIVSSGPFKYSRNPLYVSLLLLMSGLAVLINTSWLILSTILLFLLLDRTAVKKEELYLEKEFGDTYGEYRNRVRRWL